MRDKLNSLWYNFWAGLNIRKLITLIFSLGFIIVSASIVNRGLSGDKIDRELVTIGSGQLGTIACMCVSYYMGYSNGKDKQGQDKDADTIEDKDQL